MMKTIPSLVSTAEEDEKKKKIAIQMHIKLTRYREGSVQIFNRSSGVAEELRWC